MITELKEAMKKCLHEILCSEFSQNAKTQRVEWKKNTTIQCVKTEFNKEIGSLKNSRNQIKLEMKKFRNSKSLEESSNNRLDLTEEIILHLEDKVKELDHSVKENIKPKKFQEHNMKGALGHYENSKHSNSKYRRRKHPRQRYGTYFQLDQQRKVPLAPWTLVNRDEASSRVPAWSRLCFTEHT